MNKELKNKMIQVAERNLKKAEQANTHLKKLVKEALEDVRYKPNILRLDLWYYYYRNVQFIKQSLIEIRRGKKMRDQMRDFIVDFEKGKLNPWV